MCNNVTLAGELDEENYQVLKVLKIFMLKIFFNTIPYYVREHMDLLLRG